MDDARVPRVGDRIVPRHLLFSRDWVVKPPNRIVSEANLAAEREYLQSNPHQQQLRQIFDLARIEYGRIDYSIVNGKVQCWEIDMPSPSMSRPDNIPPEQMPNQQLYMNEIIAALLAIDQPTPQDPDKQIVYHLELAKGLAPLV